MSENAIPVIKRQSGWRGMWHTSCVHKAPKPHTPAEFPSKSDTESHPVYCSQQWCSLTSLSAPVCACDKQHVPTQQKSNHQQMGTKICEVQSVLTDTLCDRLLTSNVISLHTRLTCSVYCQWLMEAMPASEALSLLVWCGTSYSWQAVYTAFFAHLEQSMSQHERQDKTGRTFSH